MDILPKEKESINNFIDKLKKSPFSASPPECQQAYLSLEAYCKKKREIIILLKPSTLYCRQIGRVLGCITLGALSYFLKQPEQQQNLMHHAVEISSAQAGILLGEKIGNSIANSLTKAPVNLQEIVNRAESLLTQSLEENNLSESGVTFALKSINRDLEDLEIQHTAIQEAINLERQYAHTSALVGDVLPNPEHRLIGRSLFSFLGAQASQTKQHFEQKTQELREQKQMGLTC